MDSAPEISIADSPPQALPVEPGGIPEEVKRRSQWVDWKYAWDGKKWTKHPYNPRTRRRASSTDLTTWSPFEEVMEAYEAEKYDGIGFCFCSADPFVGIDLDKCRNPKTGEVAEWAQKIIDSFKDIVLLEASPSGCGVHLITKGTCKNGVNTKAVEVYGQDRFFTVTGATL